MSAVDRSQPDGPPTLVPSRGEIEALTRKAARGVGMSWGTADEAGTAVRRLETWGVPATDLVLALLKTLDGSLDTLQPPRPLAELAALPGPLCPIGVGVRLADARHALGTAPLALPPIHAPALLIPFLCTAAGPESAVAMTVGSRTIQCTLNGFLGTAPPERGFSGPITLARTATMATPARTTAPRSVDAAVWAALAAFAARTYVPASEASRLTGAGAGTSDND